MRVVQELLELIAAWMCTWASTTAVAMLMRADNSGRVWCGVSGPSKFRSGRGEGPQVDPLGSVLDPPSPRRGTDRERRSVSVETMSDMDSVIEMLFVASGTTCSCRQRSFAIKLRREEPMRLPTDAQKSTVSHCDARRVVRRQSVASAQHRAAARRTNRRPSLPHDDSELKLQLTFARPSSLTA